MSRFKNIFSHFALNALVLLFLILSLLFGCEKFEPKRIVKVATVTTTTISNITESRAQSGGNVTDDGGATVTARGVCWSISQNPTTANSKTSDGTGTGSFTSNLTGLSCDITYYVRAYTTNSAGTAYGSQVSFTTSQCPAKLLTLSTTSISNITENSAQSGGNVDTRGTSAFPQGVGVCWSTSQNPTISDNHTTDNIEGGYDNGVFYFSSSITGLSPGTTYYVKAYATNSVGTAYGNEVNFTTTGQTIVSPTVTTSSASDIAETSATVGGNVTDDGGATVTERGVYYGTSASPETTGTKLQIGSGTGTFSTSLTGLSAGTTYYIKAYATNSIGTSYGSEETFTTLTTPSLTTTAISAITENSAQSGGNITDNGGALVTARGVCWSTSQNPTITDDFTTDGSGTGSFTSSLTGLTQNTTYYVRAYATNSVGTAYGDEITIITSTATVTDYEGNVYQTITIGSQEWMRENLKSTKYADGIAIPLVESATAWDALNYTTDKAYCYYDNSSANRDTYGALYIWVAAMNGAASSSANPSGVRGVCPAGWHLPSDDEWKELEMYLGMTQAQADAGWFRGTDEGGKLKETGTTHWNSPNTGATNESGFSALPSGVRHESGTFDNLGYGTGFWSATEFNSGHSWNRYLNKDYAQVDRSYYYKGTGWTVRCLRD